MADHTTIAIPLSVYEDMVEGGCKMQGRIMDLELEISELQEELDRLRPTAGYTLN